MAEGNEAALKEAPNIDLKKNHLLYSFLAYLYIGSNRIKEIVHLKIALSFSITNEDRPFSK